MCEYDLKIKENLFVCVCMCVRWGLNPGGGLPVQSGRTWSCDPGMLGWPRDDELLSNLVHDTIVYNDRHCKGNHWITRQRLEEKVSMWTWPRQPGTVMQSHTLHFFVLVVSQGSWATTAYPGAHIQWLKQGEASRCSYFCPAWSTLKRQETPMGLATVSRGPVSIGPVPQGNFWATRLSPSCRPLSQGNVRQENWKPMCWRVVKSTYGGLEGWLSS